MKAVPGSGCNRDGEAHLRTDLIGRPTANQSTLLPFPQESPLIYRLRDIKHLRIPVYS